MSGSISPIVEFVWHRQNPRSFNLNMFQPLQRSWPCRIDMKFCSSAAPWALKSCAVTKKVAPNAELAGWIFRDPKKPSEVVDLSSVISSSGRELRTHVKPYKKYINQYPIAIPYQPIEHQLCNSLTLFARNNP